jgi:hypothetical protein
MNSVEDLDVFKLAHELALKDVFGNQGVSESRIIQSGRSKWGAPAPHFDVLRILKR